MSTTRLEPDGRAAAFDAGERVILSGPANHFKGILSVGGKLFLTDTRLRFRSHRINVQTHDDSFPLDAVRSVEPVPTMGIIPNGVIVSLADGRRERFVVSERAKWIESIRARLQNTSLVENKETSP